MGSAVFFFFWAKIPGVTAKIANAMQMMILTGTFLRQLGVASRGEIACDGSICRKTGPAPVRELFIMMRIGREASSNLE